MAYVILVIIIDYNYYERFNLTFDQHKHIFSVKQRRFTGYTYNVVNTF